MYHTQIPNPTKKRYSRKKYIYKKKGIKTGGKICFFLTCIIISNTTIKGGGIYLLFVKG
jgi:hypothetical protein